jgi:hypothetical protein
MTGTDEVKQGPTPELSRDKKIGPATTLSPPAPAKKN